MSRKLSWWLMGAACSVPPLWAYCYNLADERAQLAAYGFIKCGSNQTNNTLLACAASASLSLLAVGCSIIALRMLPSPRSKLRLAETITMAVPFVAVVLLVALSLWG